MHVGSLLRIDFGVDVFDSTRVGIGHQIRLTHWSEMRSEDIASQEERSDLFNKTYKEFDSKTRLNFDFDHPDLR